MGKIVKSYFEDVVVNGDSVLRKKIVEEFCYNEHFEKLLNNSLISEEEFREHYILLVFNDLLTCSEHGDLLFPKSILDDNNGEMFIGDWIESCEGEDEYLSKYVIRYMYDGECYYYVPENLSEDTVFAEAIQLAKTSTKASVEEIEMLNSLEERHKDSILNCSSKVDKNTPYKKIGKDTVIVNVDDTDDKYHQWLKDALEARLQYLSIGKKINIDDLLEYSINDNSLWENIDHCIIELIDKYINEKI